MFKIGDRVRLVSSDMPEDLYYEVIDTSTVNDVVVLATPVGTEVTCSAKVLTTDGPLEPMPHMRMAWQGLRLHKAGHLNRELLRGGKAQRRSQTLKKAMDKAESDAAWAWGQRSRT